MNFKLKFYKIKNRLVDLLNFIKLLRIEPYLILIIIEYGIKSTPNGQIIEDKICTLWYNTTDKYCHDLPSKDEHGNDDGHFKSRVLTDSAMFGTYRSYMTPVAILWVLFAGAWIDRYINGRRILILIGVTTSIIENLLSIYLSIYWKSSVYYNLLIPIPLLGGYTSINLAVQHYITSTTPPNLLSIRWLVFELCMLIATSIGQSLGGYILVQKPIFHTGQIRNYTLCYIISLILELLALTWVIFMIKEKILRKQEMEIQKKFKKTNNETKIKLKSDMSGDDKDIHPIRLLFDFENIKSMVRTALKKRPNNIRRQLFFLITSLFISNIDDAGGGVFGQFIQRVYLWTPDWTSYMGSIGLIVHSVATFTLTPLLIKVAKLNNINLAIMGFSMFFAIYVLRGSWLSPWAFYTSFIIGATPGVFRVGIKSYISTIIGSDEIGKVFGFINTVNTLSPMVFTTPVVYIFKYTIDSYPGTVFQVMASILLIPIFMLMWIGIIAKPSLKQNSVKADDPGKNISVESCYQNYEKQRDINSNVQNIEYESDRDNISNIKPLQKAGLENTDL